MSAGPDRPTLWKMARRHKAATDTAFNHAAYPGEADDISIVAALNHAF